jgi:tetratricopeptide (TPR) repeat protein
MPDSKVQILTEKDAVDRIVTTVKHGDKASARFTLVLGSGFSHGLVPTARELVEESLPLWVESNFDKERFDELSKQSAAARMLIAQRYWQKFIDQNTGHLTLKLDPSTLLPADYTAAYKAAFDPHFNGAVGEPAEARKFQRTLMRLDQPRLNAAHFLLASLLGLQPYKSRGNALFRAEAAFCRLILTTNFDPFLQIALQSVNRLYLISDTPELGVSDDILDDQTDAIHLVYLHGSIHRRSQAANEESIKALKEKNARILAPVLKRHGVIVLGYSGWDDAIVEALLACDCFDHLLYWCGREPDPFAKAAIGPRVAEILRKPTVRYVQVRSAATFMGRLYAELVEGLPRLLNNPIAQIREMLQTIDLSELETYASPGSSLPESPRPLAEHPSPDVFAKAQKNTIVWLERAERSFPNHDNSLTADSLLSSAALATALGNHEESLRLYNQALALDSNSLRPDLSADLLLARALVLYNNGDTAGAIADWTDVIESSGATAAQLAKALYNRGVAWAEQGDGARELADYTSVIELRGAPLEDVVNTLIHRGRAYYERELYSDYLRDVEAALQRDPALGEPSFNLGLALLACDRDEEALAAYERALARFPDSATTLVISEIIEAQKTWLSTERAAPILSLLESRTDKKPSALPANA